MMNHAKYTVVLKNLLDTPETKALIDKALSTYPIYEKRSKEEWIPSVVPTRSELNQKLLNHYKYREIGFETVGRFIDELEIAMIEIMPRYNQLLFSVDQDYNILYNADYTRKIEREKTNKNDQTANSSSTVESTDHAEHETNMETNGKNVHSATPQTQLSIGTKNINNVDYADDAKWDQNISSDTGSTDGNSTVETTGNSKFVTDDIENEDSLETVKGNYGQVSSQYLVDKYRETIINVEQMIINDRRIQELFMMVF